VRDGGCTKNLKISMESAKNWLNRTVAAHPLTYNKKADARPTKDRLELMRTKVTKENKAESRDESLQKTQYNDY
jgi:hypothetical protein